MTAKCNHNHNPFAPLKTTLDFPQLQEIAQHMGMPLSCGMCGHTFSLDATTADHKCEPPLFHVSVGEMKPLEAPLGMIFYMESKFPSLQESFNAGDSRPTER